MFPLGHDSNIGDALTLGDSVRATSAPLKQCAVFLGNLLASASFLLWPLVCIVLRFPRKLPLYFSDDSSPRDMHRGAGCILITSSSPQICASNFVFGRKLPSTFSPSTPLTYIPSFLSSFIHSPSHTHLLNVTAPVTKTQVSIGLLRC